MITNYEGEQILIPSSLALLPVRDIVIFPYMIIPLFVGRESSIQAVEESLSQSNHLIMLSAQKNLADEFPTAEGIYDTGTVSMILRMRKLPDGRVKILTQGVQKAKIIHYEQTEPFFKTQIQLLNEESISKESEKKALIRNVREQLERIVALGKILSPDILMVVDDIDDPGRLADLIAANLGLRVTDAQSLLEMQNPYERLQKVFHLLSREIEILTLQAKIRSQAKEELSRTQKEFFLREQMRAIKNELGDSESKLDETEELREKITACKMPPEVEKEALKQLRRLERMHPEASEASMLRTYIEWLTDAPWTKHTVDHLDLQRAKKILDEDHYNLEKVKERILEFLAVRKLKGKMKGPILCFSGPPGVGKTSLGKSIARALGRKFVRISLGGLKDEAEVRGHRRTYVGALPGRIIQGLKQAGNNNPVFVLDEIDKVGADFRGDPAAALLEVLDPEQNHAFRDHYLNVPFDLSNVMFITTCNITDTIPSALRDRLEIIQLPGYTEEEKIQIAKRHLIPKQVEAHGLKSQQLSFSDQAIQMVIAQYTREAGLRNLERALASICRKTAKQLADEKTLETKIADKNLSIFLGPPTYLREDEQEKDQVGIATGLAVTLAGGEILYVEAIATAGKGNILLTGQLGEVMKESGHAALGLIRWRAKDFGIPDKVFQQSDIHVHFPAGAVPKDGPSAGITMATAIISRLTHIPISKDLAMTGEITITGRVLPVGGIKEKALAAMRHGVHSIIIPWKNKKDLEEIPKEYRKKLTFHLVKTIDEVLRLALTKKIQLKPKKERKTKKDPSKTRGHTHTIRPKIEEVA